MRLAGSGLTQVSVDLGDDGVQDSVIVNGTASADQYDINYSQVTLNLGDGNVNQSCGRSLIKSLSSSITATIQVFGVGSATDRVELNSLGGH